MARETITVNLAPTPKFIPPWTGIGDRDFGGNGPRINLFTQIEVRNRNELWARVWMRARGNEEQLDRSGG